MKSLEWYEDDTKHWFLMCENDAFFHWYHVDNNYTPTVNKLGSLSDLVGKLTKILEYE